MNKEYSIYLENLKGRRFDEDEQQPIYSDGWINHDYPDAIKYALECMTGIRPEYSQKLYVTIQRTQNLISQQLKKEGINVDVRYQGPHATDTHIELYGDLEIMIIRKSFDGKPSSGILEMAKKIVDVLEKSMAFNKVDYSDTNRIYIQTRKPVCDISILPTVWVDSEFYKSASIEINRGVCEYNFEKKTRKSYLPFLNIARVNSRDHTLGGNLKAIVRLLFSIQQDANQPIDLSRDEILGIVYNIPTKELAVPSNQVLGILPNVSLHLNQLAADNEYRQKLLAPSKKEFVFGKKPKAEAILQLKTEIDEIIEDLKKELAEMQKTLMSPLDY